MVYIKPLIQEAKKEVFDDLDKVRVGEHSYPKNVCFKKTIYNQIKKRHLSTLQKQRKWNYGFKKFKQKKHKLYKV